MGRKPGIGAVALLALGGWLLVQGCGESGGGGESAAPEEHSVQARVVRVVDGDTIVASVDGQDEYVRYIGVDSRATFRSNPSLSSPPSWPLANRLIMG